MLLKPTFCSTCQGNEWPDKGYVPASGTGDNGVLIVAEAAGEQEALGGMPLIGKAGQFLFQNLLRVGVEREGFRVHNVLSCRPPENQLLKTPYEMAVINHCAPLLDGTISDMQQQCARTGKTFVILTLGKIAFRRIMQLDWKDPLFKEDYLCYPLWNQRYNAWVMAADHPSHIMQGNNHKLPILQFAFKRALEIAEHGLVLDEPEYLLDPSPETFHRWCERYLDKLKQDPSLYLVYDLETPYKKKTKAEDELGKDDKGDHSILRVSFCYEAGNAVSVPWTAPYLADIEELFVNSTELVGWNSNIYDDPRVCTALNRQIVSTDGMVAWHVLNSSLPKTLGSVTPYYVKNTSMWKHLSDSQPAFYSAKDADMEWRVYTGIKADLQKNGLWQVFSRHIIKYNQALSYMTRVGVLRDNTLRAEAEGRLATELDALEAQMETAVPQEARKFKTLKKAPKDLTGWEAVVQDLPMKYCASCGLQKPTKAHLKHCPEMSVTTLLEPATVYQKPLQFKISNKGMQKYQAVLRHMAIQDRKTKKITFDEPAVMKLMRKYPNDKLYPLILDYRGLDKLAGTYVGRTVNGVVVGGMPIRGDGRIHCTYNHNPSTLRLGSEDPNLQNLPRPKGPDDPATIIRNLVVAAPGHVFEATDYSGIEARLVGYFAMAPQYIRLTGIDVHTFYTAYALHGQGDSRILSSELPELHWEDAKLKECLDGLKGRFKKERNLIYKHLVHACNFGQTATGGRDKIFKETGTEHPVRTISQVMDIYFSLFPEIRTWQKVLLEQAEKDGFLRNPFGYVHRFNRVFDYKKEYGSWVKRPGDDANRVLAFLPQSSAAGIIAEAIMRLFFDRFEEAGQYLRLQVHDEILSEVPENLLEQAMAVKREEMAKPIPEMRMPASWGMGEFLTVGIESKVGPRWGSMKEVG